MNFNLWMLSKEKKNDRINYEINAQMRVVTIVLQIIFLQIIFFHEHVLIHPRLGFVKAK
jgi:hypothetical protein